MISPSLARSKLEYWNKRLNVANKKMEANNGHLRQSELWEREYFEAPYLTFASDEYIAERMIDHFHNNVRLTSKGKLSIRSVRFDQSSHILLPLFTHLNLEFSIRGGLPTDILSKSNEALEKYFVNGTPTGVRLFNGQPETIANVIVKFGKKQHLEPMLSQGRLRLTPANFYSNGSLLKAMQDLETERWFHDPQFTLALKGQKTAKLGGYEVELEDGFFKIPYSCPEYLLWSACNDIDRRLPDDFSADAALIIKSPQKFVARLKECIAKSMPNTPTWFGNVTYYDPCSFIDMKRRPETIKHFSFLYQQEWRFCSFPPENQMPTEPIEISVGSLDDIAELLTL